MNKSKKMDSKSWCFFPYSVVLSVGLQGGVGGLMLFEALPPWIFSPFSFSALRYLFSSCTSGRRGQQLLSPAAIFIHLCWWSVYLFLALFLIQGVEGNRCLKQPVLSRVTPPPSHTHTHTCTTWQLARKRLFCFLPVCGLPRVFRSCCSCPLVIKLSDI